MNHIRLFKITIDENSINYSATGYVGIYFVNILRLRAAGNQTQS